ncbi:hypothetical protein [Streptomyces melanogenes]
MVGTDVSVFVDAVRPFAEAALVQIGGEQQLPFIHWAEKKLLPALREL